MNTQHTEERIGSLKSVSLPESSRSRMRNELSAYADLHSYDVNSASQASTQSPFFSYFSASFFRVSAALVVLVSMLGGTAYAANDATPDGVLYPIKLNLTEPMQTALIPSTEGKAAWHAILAERRLEEATDLAVAGKLSIATQNTISDNFTKHVQDSSEAATQLQADGNVTAALSVRSDLEARITAHEDILTQVVTHLAVSSTNDSSVAATRDLLAVVQVSQGTVAGERLALEDSLVQSDDETTATVAIAAKTAEHSNATVAINDSATAPTVQATMRVPAPRPIVNSSSAARQTEIAAIMFKNSALLKTLVTATSTASTTPNTASSTDSIGASASGETTVSPTQNTDLK